MNENYDKMYQLAKKANPGFKHTIESFTEKMKSDQDYNDRFTAWYSANAPSNIATDEEEAKANIAPVEKPVKKKDTTASSSGTGSSDSLEAFRNALAGAKVQKEETPQVGKSPEWEKLNKPTSTPTKVVKSQSKEEFRQAVRHVETQEDQPIDTTIQPEWGELNKGKVQEEVEQNKPDSETPKTLQSLHQTEQSETTRTQVDGPVIPNEKYWDIEKGVSREVKEARVSELFNKYVQSIDEKLLGKTEEFAKPELEELFKDYGFKFEEAGLGDYIDITAADGTTQRFSFDKWLKSGREEEATKLKAFMTKHSLTPAEVIRRNYPGDSRITDKFVNDDNFKERARQIDIAAQSIEKREAELEMTSNNILEREAHFKSLMQEGEMSQQDEWEYAQLQKEKAQLFVEIEQFDKERARLIKDGQAFDRAAERYMAMKSDQGTWYGAATNQIVKGVGRPIAWMQGKYIDLASYIGGPQSGLNKEETVEVLDNIANKMGLPKMNEGETLEVYKQRLYEKMTPEQLDEFESLFLDGARKISKYGEVVDYRNPYARYSNMIDDKEGAVDSARKLGSSIGLIIPDDLEASEEYLQDAMNNSILARAALGALESLPSLASGSAAGRMISLFALTEDHVQEEMSKNPAFDNISEMERAKVAMPIALISAALENAGFSSLKTQGGLINSVAFNVAKKMSSGKITSATLNEAINNEVRSVGAKMALRAASGFAPEFSTGAMQGVSENTIKAIYNMVKGQQMFDTPESVSEWAREVLMSGVEEGLGGMMMGAPVSTVATLYEYGQGAVNQKQFDDMYDKLKDDFGYDIEVGKVRKDKIDGKITPNQAKIQIEALKNQKSSIDLIPEGIDGASRKEAFELINEKKRLEQYSVGKDKSLTKKEQDRISEINTRLEEISNGAKTEETVSVKPILSEGIMQSLNDGDARSGLVPVAELADFVGEDRTGDAAMEGSRKRIDELKVDIEKNGFKEPIVVVYDQTSGQGEASILEGNHRIAAARELGLKEIPVKFQKGTLRSNESRQADGMFPLNRKTVGKIDTNRGVKGTDMGLSVRQPTAEDVKTPETKMEIKPQDKTISKYKRDIASILSRGKKKKLLDSKKRRARTLDAFGRDVFSVLNYAYEIYTESDSVGRATIQRILKSEKKTLSEAKRKRAEGEVLTSNETRVWALNEAKDLFENINKMGVPALKKLHQSIRTKSSEHKEARKFNELVNEIRRERIQQETAKAVKISRPQMFDKDGNSMSKERMRTDRKLMGLLDKISDTYDKWAFSDFATKPWKIVTNLIENMMSTTEYLDNGNSSYFRDTFYGRINSMRQKYLLGKYEVEAQIDAIANSIDGIKGGVLGIKKALKPGQEILADVVVDLDSNNKPIKGTDVIHTGQMMHIYALSKNKTQAKKLAKMGYDQKKIDDIKSTLGPQVVEFVDKMVDFMSTQYFDTVNNVYKDVNDVSLGFVENYFPTKTMYKDEIKLFSDASVYAKFNAEYAPALKEREDRTSPIEIKDLDFFDAMDSYFDSMERFKNYAHGAKDMDAAMNTPAMIDMLNNLGVKSLFEKQLAYALNPTAAARQEDDAAKGFKKYMSLMFSFTLGAKLMQIPKQMSSFINSFETYNGGTGSKILDAGMYAVDMVQLIARSPWIISDLYQNSPKFRERIDDAMKGRAHALYTGETINTQESQSKKKFDQGYRMLRALLNAPTAIGDIGGVLGYAINYHRDISNGMSKEDAIEKFENYNQTQQTKNETEKSPLQYAHGWAGRMFSAYGSTAFLQANKAMTAMRNMRRDIARGKMPSAHDATSLAINVAIANIAFTYAGNALKYMNGSEEDKEEVGKRLKDAAYGLNILYRMPIINQPAEAAIKMYRGEKYMFNASDFANPLNVMLGEGGALREVKKTGGFPWKTLTGVAIGAKVDPFVAAAKLILDSNDEESTTELWYDVMGVSDFYRPSGAREVTHASMERENKAAHDIAKRMYEVSNKEEIEAIDKEREVLNAVINKIMKTPREKRTPYFQDILEKAEDKKKKLKKKKEDLSLSETNKYFKKLTSDKNKQILDSLISKGK